MDLLRSCYRGLMRFRLDDDPQEIQWFFCAPGAEVFRQPTPFRSLNWESDPKLNTGLGEQRPARGLWSSGARAVGMDGVDGCLFPDSWWADGIPPGVHFALDKTQSGVPFCCLPVVGGVPVSGEADVTIYGPYAKRGGVQCDGEGFLAYREVDGGVSVGGDGILEAGIITFCCGRVPVNLFALVDTGGVVDCFQGVVVPLTFAAGFWTGSVMVGGKVFTLNLDCFGFSVAGWFAQLGYDGFFNPGNAAMADFPGSTCIPLSYVFTGLLKPLTAACQLGGPYTVRIVP